MNKNTAGNEKEKKGDKPVTSALIVGVTSVFILLLIVLAFLLLYR